MNIEVGSPNWDRKATQALDDHKPVKLVVKGPDALLGAEALRRRVSGAVAFVAVVDDVALAATAVIGLIALGGLAVVAAVCLYGISQGYKVKASHKVRGPMPFDDELSFDLQPA